MLTVLIVPLEKTLGWSCSSISLAAAIRIFFYGIVGPFAAAAMERFGLRRVLITALLVMPGSNIASAFITEPWHLVATWGLFSGTASGAVALVLGATVVNRWFSKRRGLMMGLLTARTATGNLVFLPVLAGLAASGNWTRVVWTVAAASLLMVPLVWLFVRDRPADLGLPPLRKRSRCRPACASTAHRDGCRHGGRSAPRCHYTRVLVLIRYVFCLWLDHQRSRRYSPDLSLCSDHGIAEIQAAGLLAMMGVFDLFGTTASGWLTDRFDPRKLLFVYYALRGLALIYLPYSDFSFFSLSIFAIFFGLDWIATVPPPLRLTTEAFRDRDAPLVFGWKWRHIRSELRVRLGWQVSCVRARAAISWPS
jgi:sugar phosphate permease